VDAAVLEHDVLDRGLEQVGADAPRLGSAVSWAAASTALPRRSRRAARPRADAVGDEVRVAVDDLDAVELHAEDLAGDLGRTVSMPCPDEAPPVSTRMVPSTSTSMPPVS
jgi:hypothetical protein